MLYKITYHFIKRLTKRSLLKRMQTYEIKNTYLFSNEFTACYEIVTLVQKYPSPCKIKNVISPDQ